ncbi:MAG: hypothetical protein ABI863_09295 [Ginsengibacter sp.]
MFGGGSQAVRLFLDNLSWKLSRDFDIKNIQIKYYYPGEDTAEEKKNYNQIANAQSFDAVLIFLQTDISQVTQRSDPYPFGLSSTKLDQTFSMQIYESADRANSI